jgi:hypothetical protein
MSTYLVAYVVGEYDYVETKDAYGVSMRVYTQVGKKEHGQFALDVRIQFTLVNDIIICRLHQKFFHFMPIILMSSIQLLKLIKLLFQILVWGKE